MTAKVLMVLGTSSDAGKSLLVTALCHAFARHGIRVAPFKAQNMSNNAAVCPDGSEIGRAQATQAMAAGLQPTVNMNPVLIKPEADSRAQVIVLGKPWDTLPAQDYYQKKAMLWQIVTKSLDQLREEYDLVIMEGAGSPVEMNLKPGDIVNMSIAKYANAPVLLVGDIDRGGIFAQLLGTLWLLPDDEKALVRGLVVNKFRGDINLFTDGIEILEEKGNVPVLGVLPHLRGLHIPDEDSMALDHIEPVQLPSDHENWVDIAIIQLPRIANFDDFDPLHAEPQVRVRYVSSVAALGQPDAIIIPGTKSSISDMQWLNVTGLADAIANFSQAGGAVVGICGGYQMLGEVIHDEVGVEGNTAVTPALNLLPIKTHFEPIKATHQVVAKLIPSNRNWTKCLQDETITGYEIHMGRTESLSPWINLTTRSGQVVSVADGGMSENGRIWGCYLHGLFANARLRRAWLTSLGWTGGDEDAETDPFAASLSRLADTVESVLDMTLLEKIIWGS
ncbi:MAG: cobyric acid synthase [Chloroflexi bacterium]|nr:MAG: cobyric acid synthase [Chloroflexota bacterium]